MSSCQPTKIACKSEVAVGTTKLQIWERMLQAQIKTSFPNGHSWGFDENGDLTIYWMDRPCALEVPFED